MRSHMGLEADYYALTSQNNLITDLKHHTERIRIEAVHDIWHILGHHLRRIYELIAHHGLTYRDDIYAAAAVSRSTGDEVVRQLQIHGLIAATAPKMLGPGPVTPTVLAEGHINSPPTRTTPTDLPPTTCSMATMARYPGTAKNADTTFDPAKARAGDAALSTPPYNAFAVTQDYLDSVLRTGPPEDIERLEDHAIGLVETIMGQRCSAAVQHRPNRHSDDTTPWGVAVPSTKLGPRQFLSVLIETGAFSPNLGHV